MNTSIKTPELLCPAGDLVRLRASVDFGADAVYLAGEEFGMRSASPNFTPETLKEGVEYAHDRGVKVYVTCNIIPHDDEMERLPEFLIMLNEIGVDAIIASDLGTINLIKRYAPDCALHISVQAGIVNTETARAFYEMGAKRVVLARELSLEEIRKIRAGVPDDLEIEAFVHGAMCVSFSARCLLSSYMTGRDANRGDCAQPCRWSYSLMEEKRPGVYLDITETDRGTYVFNSDDMCMVRHLKELSDAGICSFKIEGRAKSEYYAAVTANAYRGALDAIAAGETETPQWVIEELEKISHRPYCTGFYYGQPTQTPKTAGYIRNYAIAAVVDGYDDGCIVATLKNKFLRGVTLDCLEAGKAPFAVPTDLLMNCDGEVIDSAPSPMMTIKIPFDRPVKSGSMLRIKL